MAVMNLEKEEMVVMKEKIFAESSQLSHWWCCSMWERVYWYISLENPGKAAYSKRDKAHYTIYILVLLESVSPVDWLWTAVGFCGQFWSWCKCCEKTLYQVLSQHSLPKHECGIVQQFTRTLAWNCLAHIVDQCYVVSISNSQNHQITIFPARPK